MRTAALYAGLLGLVLLALTVSVSAARSRTKTNLGDGGDEVLRRRIRAHGNFCEFVPLAVLLLALSEHLNLGTLWIHLLGILLLLSRLAHAYGISQADEVFAFRIFGMAGTFLVLAVTSLYCIVSFF